ncbi:ArsA family ATPase [Actinopolyspora mortivallis]|uniref:ArsA family ATPase n=1 Tax=Actinopolyspora mortivallis TaxID=33906 RepID=UPI00037B6494|nr:ArsA family ATPase [Actinopolyspora mortivallis]
MNERSRPERLDVDALLRDPANRIVVCCGSGGVGKTTTAAALGLRAAHRGRRTVVLTIDPARRLAQALGLAELDNKPGRVELDPSVPGELYAMMLDMRRTFDDMVLTHAGRERARQILDNPFYRTVSTSFSGTQEYMAMEKLGQLAAEGSWDLIIVDTPPSRSALDFLDAPQRLSTILDGRLIRMLASPARAGGKGLRKLVGAGFGVFARTVSTIVGHQLLSDAAAFVQAFDSTFGGFRERAEHTYRMLRSQGTRFLVVATPEADALREASYFVERLSSEGMPLSGLVVNRTHPVLADLPAARAVAAAEELEEAGGSPLAASVLRLHADRVAVAEREKRLLARFTRAHPEVGLVGVPALPGDVHDLDGLDEVGTRLAG